MLFSGMLVGNMVEIVDSTDKTLVNLSGRILDETKNTLVIESSGSRITVPKSIVCFDLLQGSRKIQKLNGRDLIGTPQERINKI